MTHCSFVLHVLGFTAVLEFDAPEEAQTNFDDAFAAIKREYPDARLKEKNQAETLFKLMVCQICCLTLLSSV